MNILEAGGSVVRFPEGEGDFSHLPNVETGYGSPSLIFNGYRSSYPDGKMAGV